MFGTFRRLFTDLNSSDSSRLQFVQFARLVQTPEAWNGGKVVRLVGLR